MDVHGNGGVTLYQPIVYNERRIENADTSIVTQSN